MRADLVVLPAIRRVDDFRDVLSRIAFHFSIADWERVTIPVEADTRSDVDECLRSFAVPDAMDPAIGALVSSITDRVVCVEPEELDHRTVAEAGVVLVWDAAGYRPSRWAELLIDGRRVANVDPREDPLEGSRYVEAALALYRRHDRDVVDSRRRFREWAVGVAGTDIVYLLGTGPSLERFREFDLTSGLVIACNAVIFDSELIEATKPDVVTFADPIHHFGVSRHAADFRAALTRALERHDLKVVVPSKYLALLRRLIPEHAARLIGVPMMRSPNLNHDLLARFAVTTSENVLTALMLPVGATIGRRIRLLGFDGRDPGTERDTFWRYAEIERAAESVSTVRELHPAFFERSLPDYFERHIGAVERSISDCESRGVEVTSLAPSFVPAVHRRFVDIGSFEVPQLVEGMTSLAVSLNPDWIDDFGHYAAQDRLLRSAFAGRGIQMISLSSRGRRHPTPHELPTFTHPTRQLADGHPGLWYRAFRREAVGALLRIRDEHPHIRIRVFMYSAGLGHVAAGLELAAAMPDVGFAFNLLRDHGALTSSPDVTDPDSAVSLLKEIVDCAGDLRVAVASDSMTLREWLVERWGIELRAWPFFSVTEATVASDTVDGGVESRPLRVYCPASMQYSKGYDVFAAAAAILHEAGEEVECTIRYVQGPAGTDPRLAEAAATAVAAGARMVEGTVSSARYAAELERCDVVVIPYRLDPFHTRTSGVLADALNFGKPAIATENTWAGRLVTELGVGLTVREGDTADVVRAVRAMAHQLAPFTEAARRVGRRWAHTNSPSALAEFIDELPLGAQDVSAGSSLASIATRFARNPLSDASSAQRSRAMVAEVDSALLAALAGIEAREARIAELDDAISGRDGRIESLQTAVADRDRSVDRHRRLLADERATLTELKERLSRRAEVEESLRGEIGRYRDDVEYLRGRLRNRLWAALARRFGGRGQR